MGPRPIRTPGHPQHPALRIQSDFVVLMAGASARCFPRRLASPATSNRRCSSSLDSRCGSRICRREVVGAFELDVICLPARVLPPIPEAKKMSEPPGLVLRRDQSRQVRPVTILLAGIPIHDELIDILLLHLPVLDFVDDLLPSRIMNDVHLDTHTRPDRDLLLCL